MSATYCIACTHCKKALWIGQAGINGRWIYRAMPGVMEKLEKFLWDHKGHSLVFEEDQILYDEDEDYEEIPISEDSDREINRLEEENARMREALEKVKHCCKQIGSASPDIAWEVGEIEAIAKQVLKGE